MSQPGPAAAGNLTLHDVTGRSCLVKNVTVRATGKYAFSIAEKDLTDCKK